MTWDDAEVFSYFARWASLIKFALTALLVVAASPLFSL
jgi:hypothetical protein